MYWARSMSNMTNPMMNFIERLARSESGDDEEDAEIDEETDGESDVGSGGDDDKRSLENSENNEDDTPLRAKRDLTAGQFYSGLKETMS